MFEIKRFVSAFLMACFILPPALRAQGSKAHKPASSLRSIVEYNDDYGGYITVRGHGNLGGHFYLRYDFRGFYLVARRPLSDIKKKGIRISSTTHLADYYLLIPKKTSVFLSGSLIGGSTFESPGKRTDCWEDIFILNQNGDFEAPPREEFEAKTEKKGGENKYSTISLFIEDRSPVGGAASLKLSALSLQLDRFRPSASGKVIQAQAGKYTFIAYDAPGVVRYTHRAGVVADWVINLGGKFPHYSFVRLTGSPWLPSSTSVNNAVFALNYENTDPIVIEDPSKLTTDLYIAGKSSQEIKARDRRCSYLKQDMRFKVDINYYFGLYKELDAELAPVDTKENWWLPEPDEVREYKLTLKEPTHEDIDAVRFYLTNTSKYPGIATNAGNHLIKTGSCDDGTRGLKDEWLDVKTEFHENTFNRTYNFYNDCPVDSMPDIFFRDIDNDKEFTYGDEATSEELQYTASQEALLENPDSNEIKVKLAIKDAAANAHLHAEVSIGDIWYPVKAVGSTASDENEFLFLPLDKDGDGIQDKWAEAFNVNDPGEDLDTHSSDTHPGDGLTAFEEYRGVIRNGSVYRTDPQKKTIFVHDYSGIFKNELFDVGIRYSKHDLQLFTLDGDEFKEEIVNFSDTEYRHGAEYAIIIMDAKANMMPLYIKKNVTWSEFAGLASHVGPPQLNSNTIAINFSVNPDEAGYNSSYRKSLVGVLAHEIGHQINIAHHGSTDERLRIIDGKKHYVAAKNGEHSGNIYSFMIYTVADKFCDSQDPLDCDDDELKDFPRTLLRREIFSDSPAGTGLNSNGAWAGDAGVGLGDLEQLNVKSY